MDRSDFREYLQTFSTYLDRLGTRNDPKNTTCTFCDFQLDPQRGGYKVGERVEQFVSTTRTHQELWDDGLILTYNPSGWHLINELIIPRTHTSMIEYLLNETKDIFSTSYARWERHSVALTTEYADRHTDYYHAMVANLGAGQSVWHGHVHCYTSDFDTAEYREQRISLVEADTNIGPVKVSVVPLDHPRLVYTMDIESIGADAQTARSIHRLFNTGVGVMKSLFNMIPPMSIGWFCSQDFTDLRMLLHPLQRTGTAQVFQRPELHKFSTQTVSAAVQDVLINKLTEMYPNKNISHRQV
jgi:hypothetical protein